MKPIQTAPNTTAAAADAALLSTAATPARAAASAGADAAVAAPPFAQLLQRAAQRTPQPQDAALPTAVAVVAGTARAPGLRCDAVPDAAIADADNEAASGDDSAPAAAPAATDIASLMAALLQRPAPSPQQQQTADTRAAAAQPALAVPTTGHDTAAVASASAPEAKGNAPAAGERPHPTAVAAIDVQPFTLAAAQPAPTAAPLPAPLAAAPSPAPYAAQIAAPVGSPDFAPGLSAQVSLMLRDGAQEARLELNPPEMGPITVQIAIDGASAQVTMAAEVRETRQALEQAMPELAGTLRDSGLTLTGGGVFDQPRRDADASSSAQQRPDGAPPRGMPDTAGAGADAATGVTATAAPALRPRGLVDLFA